MKHPLRTLKPWAEELNWQFEKLDTCCSCHISPPCGHCTDPGNINNLYEDDDAWEVAPDNRILLLIG